MRACNFSDIWEDQCYACFAVLSLWPALRGAWTEIFMLLQAALGKQTKPLGLMAVYCSHLLICLLGVFLFGLIFLCEWSLSFICIPKHVHSFSLSFVPFNWDHTYCHITTSNPCREIFSEQKRNPVAARKLVWKGLWSCEEQSMKSSEEFLQKPGNLGHHEVSSAVVFLKEN